MNEWERQTWDRERNTTKNRTGYNFFFAVFLIYKLYKLAKNCCGRRG